MPAALTSSSSASSAMVLPVLGSTCWRHPAWEALEGESASVSCMNSSLSLAYLALASAGELGVCAMRVPEIRTQATAGKSCMVPRFYATLARGCSFTNLRLLGAPQDPSLSIGVANNHQCR